MAKVHKATQRSLERQERIVKLAKLGLEDAEIADALGVTEKWVAILRREAGIKRRHTNALSPETIERIHYLIEVEQWPPAEVAATLGIHATTVHQHVGATQSGKDWNAVARWASRNHNKLWEELRK